MCCLISSSRSLCALRIASHTIASLKSDVFKISALSTLAEFNLLSSDGFDRSSSSCKLCAVSLQSAKNKSESEIETIYFKLDVKYAINHKLR